MRNTKKSVIIISLIGLVLISGFVMIMFLNRSNTQQQTDNAIRGPSLIDTNALGKLATTEVPIDTSHLADGLTPPTNKWFSGFALQAEPKPGFSYPLSFKPTAAGFEFGLPNVSSSKTSINGPHTPDIVVSIDGASRYEISRYDELTVDLTYYNGDTAIATVTVGSGLPYIYINAGDQDVNISFSGHTKAYGSMTRIESNNATYGVNQTARNNQLEIARNELVSFFSVPRDSNFNTIATHANAIVTSASVSYKRTSGAYKTTFNFDTKNNQPTLFAKLPHQAASQPSPATYRSILGDLHTEIGTSFSYEVPAIEATPSLNLKNITNKQRTILIKQLKKDLASTVKPKTDTYFGGKQLYRTAQLASIAEQLGQTEVAKKAQSSLRDQLQKWLQVGSDGKRSFLYDKSMGGIVGNEASFGSDKEFNDHHFHYGYFIYAAAILAEHDEHFQKKYEPIINLLVADIANYNTDEALPLRRNYDPYAGHSWASGVVPFNDGNNQESTSEAINAWVGVALWAKQTNNQKLSLEAEWMLSNEYATAQRYWLLHSEGRPSYLANYQSPVVSIVWGGKREYATFFSDQPNAKLAIQLLPLSPTLKKSGTKISDDQLENTSTHELYGDYIFMASQNTTLEEAMKLPNSAIDSGDSRTYLYSYVLAQ